jgi:hypothetical protein
MFVTLDVSQYLISPYAAKVPLLFTTHWYAAKWIFSLVIIVLFAGRRQFG